MFEEYKIRDIAKDSILDCIEYVNVTFEQTDMSNREQVATVLGRALGVLHYVKSELERAERV